MYAGQAELGDWKGAWSNMQELNETIFYQAGGNGHSRTNSLWYVSTRPDYKRVLPNPNPSHMPSKPQVPVAEHPVYDWRRNVPTF